MREKKKRERSAGNICRNFVTALVIHPMRNYSRVRQIGRRAARESVVCGGAASIRPFIYITYRRNVANREIDITAVPARDVARCPLYRAFAYKHTPTNNTAVRALHSNVLTPPEVPTEGTRRCLQTLAPYLHLPMCPLFVPSSPRPTSGEKVKEEERESQGCGEMRQHECTAMFLRILPPFSKLSRLYLYLRAFVASTGDIEGYLLSKVGKINVRSKSVREFLRKFVTSFIASPFLFLGAFKLRTDYPISDYLKIFFDIRFSECTNTQTRPH